jgi:hypothetical protein
MSEIYYNNPEYFNIAPEHMKKQFEKMVIKTIKKEIRRGLLFKIKKEDYYYGIC